MIDADNSARSADHFAARLDSVDLGDSVLDIELGLVLASAIAHLIDSDNSVDPIAAIVDSIYGLTSHHMVVAPCLPELWLEYLNCVGMAPIPEYRSSHHKSGVEAVTQHFWKQA